MASDVRYPVNAGFFHAINGDRAYSSEDMNRPYRKLVSNGVFANPKGTPSDDLQVFTADNGMNVIVSKGDAIIGNKWFENPNDLIITISQNTELLTRIDSIIAQVDRTQTGRVGSIVYRQGSASSNPMHPNINIEENIFEFRLADIIISPSCIKVTQDLITDCRGSNECPWITSLIQQVDTSTLFLQWETAYENFYNNSSAEFESWFNNIKEMLNESVAGKLQLEIDNLKSTKADIPRCKDLTLSSANLVLNEENQKYEYTILDDKITENDFPDCVVLNKKEVKLTDDEVDPETQEGKLIIRVEKLPAVDMIMNVVLIRTIPDTTETDNTEGGDTQ